MRHPDRRHPVQARRSIAAISAACAVVVAIAGEHAAGAQSAEAEALFEQGSQLMAAGKLADACDAFEASNRIESRAGTLVRLGECREQNHQLASAWSAYKDALTRARDPRKRDIAVAKVAQLEPRLSYLTVSVADDARVDGLALARNGGALDPGLWNRAVPVNGGQYIIAGRAPGHEEWQTTVTVPDEGGKVAVEVPKFKELAKLVPSPSADSKSALLGTHRDGDDGDVVRPLVRWTPRRKLALGVAGGAVLAVGAGAALGVVATARQHDALALCPDPHAPCGDAGRATALVHAGHQLALVADVGFAVGAAAAIGAGVLWLTGAPPRARRVALVPTATGFALAGSF